MNSEHFEQEGSQPSHLEGDSAGFNNDAKAVSTDIEPEQHPRSHLFTLRVWQESLGQGRVEWRGRVQELESGDTLFFRDWPGLISTLQRMIVKTPGPYDGIPGQPLRKQNRDE